MGRGCCLLTLSPRLSLGRKGGVGELQVLASLTKRSFPPEERMPFWKGAEKIQNKGVGM